MAQMTAQLILAALLIYSNSAKPSAFFTEDRNTGELIEKGLQSKTDGKEQQLTELPFYCDTESLLIGVSPIQYPLVYLLRDDGTRFSISQLLKVCSHVELQSASLIRIFFRGCNLLDWLGQEKQYTVKLGSSHLNEDTVQTQTCPSAPPVPVQLPDVKCEGANMTVLLAAKELRVARFIDLNASSVQEKIMIEGDGLTQWKDGEKLVVQVENPMMEDQVMLLLQFTDISDKLNMVKVFCPQRHPILQRKTQTKNIYKHSDTHHAQEASEYTAFPFIQWAMPVFMSEQFSPSPIYIYDSLQDTTATPASTAEENLTCDIPETTTSSGTVLRTTPVPIPPNAAAGTTVSSATPAPATFKLTSSLTSTTEPDLTGGGTTTQTTQPKATISNLSGVLWALVAKTTKQSFEQITAENPSECWTSNSEVGHQSEPVLTNTESVPETTTAATSTEASMMSGEKSTADATTKATQTSKEPETLSSTNKEPHNTIVKMKTPPAETNATANTTPVKSTMTTPNSTESSTTAHEETKTTTTDSNTESNTCRTTPTNTRDAETNPTAWTSMISTPGTASNLAETRKGTTTSTPTASSPVAPTVPDVECVVTAGTALKNSTVERNTTAAATAADSSGRTTTGFQNISTKLSTTASGPSTMKSSTTVTRESPGSVTPLTTSRVNILATATQTMLTEATSTFNPLKTAALPETTSSVDSALNVRNPTAALSAKPTIKSPTVTLMRSTSANVLNSKAPRGTTQTASSALHCAAPSGAQTAASVIEALPAAEQRTPSSGESAGGATSAAATSPAKSTVETETVSTTEPTVSSTTAAPFPPTSLPGITAEAEGSSTPARFVNAKTIPASTAVKISTASTTQPASNHTVPAVFGCIPATTTPGVEAAATKRETTSAAASITTQAAVSSSAIASTVTTPSEIDSTGMKNTPMQVSEKVTSILENIISIDTNSPNTVTASNSQLVSTLTPKLPAGEVNAPAISTTEAPLLNITTAATAVGLSTPANIWTADLQTLQAAPVPPAAGELSVSTTATPDPVSELCNDETIKVQTSINEDQAVINHPYDIIWGSSDTTTTTPQTVAEQNPTAENTSNCNNQTILQSGPVLTTTVTSTVTQTSKTSGTKSTTPTRITATRTSTEPATLNC